MYVAIRGTKSLFLVGEREINALRVKCANLTTGCDWEGELGSLEEHQDKCDHALISCPNECKDETTLFGVLRKDLATHLKEKCRNRNSQCPHCGEEGKHCDITTSHLHTCPQVVIPCPNNGCSEKVLRCMIQDHWNMCLFEVIPCKYSTIGCKDKPLRKELNDHEQDDRLHLHIAMETILKVAENVGQMQTRLTRLQSEYAHIPTTTSSPVTFKTLMFGQYKKSVGSQVTFKMPMFSQYKESKEMFCSPPFYTHQGGYKMCIKVNANGAGSGEGTHISLGASLMRGENDDNLTWPFTGTVTVDLLNQLADQRHHRTIITYQEGKDDQHNRRVVAGEMSAAWGRFQFVSHSALRHNPWVRNIRQYLKDDCLYFRVSVKPSSYTKPWLTCTA